MERLIELLRNLPLLSLAMLFFLENVLILAAVLIAGHLLVRRFRDRSVSLKPAALSGAEVRLAVCTVLFNSLVTVAGLCLWRRGLIRFRTDAGLFALLDVFVLIFVMDFLMYGLHRAAHTRWLFPFMHRTHHAYERVRPLTLFLLNPIENLGFGLLWLAVISIYPASWIGMSVYLTINVAFGTMGHLGVEPLPSNWTRRPIIGQLSTSTFHAQHHRDFAYNYGFYTLIWDRLFGTLSPRYETEFGRLPAHISSTQA